VSYLDTLCDPEASSPIPDVSTRNGRLLAFLYKLFDFGLVLADTLRQGLSARKLYPVALIFGTTDVMLMLRRIGEGMWLAGRLETRLYRRPLREWDAPDPVPRRQPCAAADPGDAEADAARAEAAARRAATAARRAQFPTARQIAEDLGRRPTWAVIADICRMLGITPVDHELWNEMVLVITENGGSVIRLHQEICNRMITLKLDPPPGWVPTFPRPLAELGTGPP